MHEVSYKKFIVQPYVHKLLLNKKTSVAVALVYLNITMFKEHVRIIEVICKSLQIAEANLGSRSCQEFFKNDVKWKLCYSVSAEPRMSKGTGSLCDTMFVLFVSMQCINCVTAQLVNQWTGPAGFNQSIRLKLWAVNRGACFTCTISEFLKYLTFSLELIGFSIHSFVKNILYKNIEAEICEILRIF